MRLVTLVEVTSNSGRRDVVAAINALSGLLGTKTSGSMHSKTFYCGMLGEEAVGITGSRQVNKWLVEQVHTIVFPKHRGKGFGRAISDAATKKLLLTYGKVFCTVNENNVPMVRIKRSQGFEQEGKLIDHFAKGRTILVFSKRRK